MTVRPAVDSFEFGRDAEALVRPAADDGWFVVFEVGSEVGGVIADDSFFFVWLDACLPAVVMSLDLLSRECVAAGVRGGDCIRVTGGVMRGELLSETVALAVSRELTY